MCLFNKYLEYDCILKCFNNIYEISFWYNGYNDIVIHTNKEIQLIDSTTKYLSTYFLIVLLVIGVSVLFRCFYIVGRWAYLECGPFTTFTLNPVFFSF